MIINHAEVLSVILQCIDKVNAELPPQDRIERSATIPIAGEGSAVGSLTLINLILEVEEAVVPLVGRRIDILDGAATGEDGLQFSSVHDLAKWIADQSH